MIKINELTKQYSNGKGVFDIDFEVSKGEIFGFLGPNGSGKTTTIRCLMGFTNPTRGNCAINGLDCRHNASDIHKTLGYVSGEMAFMDNMTGNEFLNFIGNLRNIKDNSLRDELVDRFELEKNRIIRKMSKGMKQKVGLIAALMHNPDILILDEPTSGLDPLMQKIFIDLIIEEKNKGKTILMSSHIFNEVDLTCERVAIIKDGKIVAIENITNMKNQLTKSFQVTVKNSKDIEKIKASGLNYKTLDNYKVEISIVADYNKMLSTLSKCNVLGLDTTTQTLDQIFLEYYRGGEG